MSQYPGPSFQTSIQKAKSNSKSFEEPTPRVFHSLVCHRSFIYIYGGLSLNPLQQFQNEHLFIYRYQIHKFEWKKIQTNFPNNLSQGQSNMNPLQNIYSHACAVHGNVMYLFGGKSGKNGHCHNELWAMNLESFNWRKQDQKGVVPSKRQSASLVVANKSNLFLYGGKFEEHILKDINIYKIESKQWYTIETGNMEFLMGKRLRPGITVVNDIVYLFGGQRESSVSENSQTMDDMYQIKIIQKSTSVKPDVWVKKISTTLKPGKIVGAKLFNVNDRFVGLIGSHCSQSDETKTKLWLYDPLKIKWVYSCVQDSTGCSPGVGYAVLFQYDRVYISGGLRQNMSPGLSLCSIHVDLQEVPQQFASSEPATLCLLCQEDKHSLVRKKLASFSLLEQSLTSIPFAFNAFGLLVDNSNLIKSTHINIEALHLNKEKFLLIEDDGQVENLWSTEEEFLEDMIKFRTILQQEMEVEDDIQMENSNKEGEEENKKRTYENMTQEAMLEQMKKDEDKEEEKKLKKKKELAKKSKARKIRKRKQFSVNLKLGGMRIAKKLIYITTTPEGHKRVFFMEEVKIHSLDEEEEISLNQIHYNCHYFIIPNQSSTSAPHSHFSSEQTRNLIEGEYKNYLKAVKENTNFKNHLLLIGLRETLTEDGVREGELKYNTKLNDIYLGSVKMICKAESLNMPLGDSVDVSLKCYLSMLYLKGESAKITLSTAPQKVEEVSNAQYFDKIDTLVKSSQIMDLEAAFDLEECKIVELYYYKNLLQTRKAPKERKYSCSKQSLAQGVLPVFVNGILIYHRNRLIKRFEYPLGSLLTYSSLKNIPLTSNKINFNPLKTFGFIELDEVFYSNIFKTDFVNDQNLHNMYARIRFVQNYLQNKTDSLPAILTSKRSHKRLQPDMKDEQQQTRKKLKGQ